MSWDNLARVLYDELADEFGMDEVGSVHDRDWWHRLANIVREYARSVDPDDDDPVGFVVSQRWRFVDVPVVNGLAYLPDGRTVASTASVVRIPVLIDPDELDAEELDPSAPWNIAGVDR